MSVSVIIAAGGKGSRMNLDVCKQLLELNNFPIIHYSISVFESIEEVTNILLVVNEKIIDDVKGIINHYNYKKIIGIIKGGKERQDSVFSGLQFCKNNPPDIVLIHDAVRPFINKSFVRSIILATEKYDAVIPALNLKDTIKYTVNGKFISNTPDRDKFRVVQTPQGFKFNLLFESYIFAKENKVLTTDDSSIVEINGVSPFLVEGLEQNLKITTQNDLMLAKTIINYHNFYQ